MSYHKSFYLEESVDTPKIVLDSVKSIFLIEGFSYPEDAYELYDGVLNWLRQDNFKFDTETVCEFKFQVLSSASKKMIQEILLILERAFEMTKNIIIHWYYQKADEDMREVGEDFSDLIKVPFKILPQ